MRSPPPGVVHVGFSILVPVKEINDFIRESVPVILRLDHGEFEVILLPNETPAGDPPPFTADPRVRIVATGRVSPAVKRDMGAAAARYDRLAFLDDDAYPRADWLRAAEAAFAATGAAAIGGPAVTPPDSPLLERASGLFFETFIGGGGMDYRYLPSRKAFPVDDFPTVNLLVERRAFEAVGGFDNTYWPGEDTKFCLDLRRAGFPIWYSPDVLVYHHRRPLLRQHLRQVANYGLHRGYFAKTFPETSARPVYFVPSLFLLGSVGLLVLGFVHTLFWKVLVALMAVYAGIALVDIFSRTSDPVLGLVTLGGMYCSHLAYGAMFIRGLLTPGNFRSRLR